MTTTAPRLDWLSSDKDFQLPRSWGNWHLFRKRYLVHSPSGKPSRGGYDIDLWEINSHKELVDWLFHVGGKTYGGDEGFYDAMHDIFRDAAWSDSFTGKQITLAYWDNSANNASS